ncbi:DNA-binding response regulator [Actinoplanes sp. CA-131856]
MLHVAVLDPLPLFRQGVMTVLAAAGHRVEAPEHVVDWAVSRQRAAILLTLLDDADWQLLASLRDLPGVDVVGFVQDLRSAAIRAVHLGARSVLPRAASPEAVLRAVEATADGQSVVPVQVLAKLAGTLDAQPGVLTEAQLSWLRRLAAGATVADLADAAGYSERAMFRLLKQLYADLGVRNRMQAVLRAQELGWLPVSVRGR